MVKVFDFAPFWRERWAFEARKRLWADLAPGVDYRPVAFVGDRTHRGDPKPDGLPSVPEGVETVTVTLDAPEDWGRERQQRDAARGYVSVATFGATEVDPDDLILLCDADELVDPRRLPAILEATESGPVKLGMLLYYYGTTWRDPHWWTHPAGCRARDLPPNPSEALRCTGVWPFLPACGWHVSWTGSDEDRLQKLGAFAHAEYDTADVRELLAKAALEGLDPHGQRLTYDPLRGPLADWLANHG